MTEISRKKAVEVRSVSKVFGSFQALKKVSFDIFDNEFFTLLGPSGCGKTTLLRMIAGFESPSTGDISLHGEPIAELPPHKRRVNTVFQSYALFPHMNLQQNIAYGLENLGWARDKTRDRVAEMLELVHMSEFARRSPSQLSGGQRQRIALARALAAEPEVLLLDEPLSALDLKLRQAMRDELRQLQRHTGITFVFVTHDQEEALDMSDRICVLGEGEIQQLGPPMEIYENPSNRFVADFIGETNFFDVEVLALDGDKVRVKTPLGVDVSTYHKHITKVGQAATLSLRPEKIGLNERDADITLSGTIVNKNYLGGYTHYIVRVGELDFRVSKRNTRSPSSALDLHAKVSIGFQQQSTRVLGQ